MQDNDVVTVVVVVVVVVVGEPQKELSPMKFRARRAVVKSEYFLSRYSVV